MNSTGGDTTLSVGDVDRLLIDRLKAALRDRDLDTTGDIHAMRRRSTSPTDRVLVSPPVLFMVAVDVAF